MGQEEQKSDGKTEDVKLLNHHIGTFRTKVYEARLANWAR
jgi:hypothetical protein